MRLSLPQQDVYYEQLLYPGEPIYNIGAKISIKGPLRYEALNQAYITLIDQHDAYRSIVVQDHNEAQIAVLPEHGSVLQFLDLSGEEDADTQANRYMQETFTKAFDFNDRTLLHRFVLIKVSDSFHYLFSMYHHIITDGWGTSLMFQRWVKNYNELITTGSITPQTLYTYSDFVADDGVYAASAEFEEDKQYWKGRFGNLPERLFQKIDPQLYINKSSRKELIVPRPLYNQLEALASTHKCSTFHVILALLYMYFGRRCQNRDFAIGLPVLNRGKSAFKKTVGLFMGVSTLRMQFSFDDTFEDLVCNIKQQLRQDYRHQRFPLGKLIQELDVFREKDRLFNITLSYEKQNYADQFLDTQTRVVPLTHGAERVALAIYIREFDEAEDVKIDFDYHINYFDEATISGIIMHFEQLLQQVCADPKQQLSGYKYLTRAEEEQLLYTFNQTQWEYPRELTFLSFFDQQVKDRAEYIAIVDDEFTYTYRQLDEWSTRIANRLLTYPAIKEKAPVAVLMPRSANLVVTLLGILKAGTAYIPLDPDFPQARLQYIADHSRAACIIGAQDQQHIISSAISFICIDDLTGDQQQAVVLPGVTAADTAYIIYTSGSTGAPKGVEIGHRSLLNFLLSIQQRPGITAQDTFFSVTTQSFDISILEFFAPLIAGAKLYIAPKQLQQDPVAMIAKLEAIRPNMIQATPGFYQILYNAGWKGNKGLTILCGGDLLSASLAEKLLGTCAALWNMYGPTETTIWSSTKHIQTPDDASNIGTPIHNTQFYILDEQLQPLPVGCPGAIYIGGEGLAKGYYKNEVLTAEKFIPHPFNPGQQIYETGDLGQWNSQGEIKFLGRNDNQVKIRGYRIELGEIEAKLNQLPAVRSSVVIAKKKTAQEAFLVAYIVPAQEPADTAALIKALQKELPEYMIPYIMIPVTDYPLTPNNKIDRKALAAREVQQPADAALQLDPETSLETALCRLFKEALEWEGKLGVTDNFFSMGGHSLNAMKVVNLVQQQLYYRVSLKDIFNHPTVQALAGRLREQGTVPPKGISSIADRPCYPVSPAQYALWLAAQQGRQRSVAYNVFVVYEITGKIDVARLEQAFTTLIAKYEILRTNFIEIEGIPHQKIGSTRFQIDIVPDTAAAYVNKAFDLENDLLLRVGLVKTAQGYLLAFSSHHIILDGWSMGELIREISQLYRAAGVQNQPLPFQFRDYVAWLQQTTQEWQQRNEWFWENYLLGYRWKTILPAAQGDEYAAAEHHFQWEGDFFESLKAAAHQQNSTLHTFLLTAFLTLLHKISGEPDLCIGTINSGRTIASLHNQVGMFVKTLPLRSRFKPQQSFAAQLRSVHNDLLEMDAHQDIPENIYNTLWPDILFVLQPPAFNYDHIVLDEEVQLQLHPVAPAYSRLPLLINFIEAKESLRCAVHYSTGKYDPETIALLFMRFESILTQVIAQAAVTTGNLDPALAFEKEQALDIHLNF
ncbi:amino acid adenylation domain-containing protein [Chitinophaga rupis]|uniref:Amino acid adenylation domain-containing protein n=1 Tax=Chitinophaga rupis TaxID=573321 RepID=A0A1H8B6U8_9BACT|nr:non-ribosomal peptide synthetase [Chitinophaga rupis]SEM77768.1 amino acid adenylation domain-containing protein [Chitinophaga rupis]